MRGSRPVTAPGQAVDSFHRIVGLTSLLEKDLKKKEFSTLTGGAGGLGRQNWTYFTLSCVLFFHTSLGCTLYIASLF